MVQIYILPRRGTIATTFCSRHPGRDSQGPRFLPSDIHLLGRDDRCVVIATAIFMDRCSCRQKVRGLLLQRRFADPLSTNKKKGAPCSLMTWHSASPSSSIIFLAPEGTDCALCHSGVVLCFSGLGHGLRYYHVPGKDAVHRCAKWARCCILAFNLSSCVCGRFTKFPHCVYLTIRGKIFRDSRWFRQARKLLLIACGGMAKSARCCPTRPSRRFAKRAMEQMALHSQGSIAFCLHSLRKTVLFSFCVLLVLLSCSRECLLDVSRLLGSYLLFPPGFPDALEAGICAGSRACWFFFVFSMFF